MPGGDKKANSITLVAVLGLFAPLVAPVLLTAQNIEGHLQHHHYKPIDVGIPEIV